eukprot:COSAG02_NODE_5826_length_4010_cov_2.625415_2_plen_206_part_00
MAYVPPHRARTSDPRRADAARNLHRVCTEMEAHLTDQTAAGSPVLPQIFGRVLQAATEAAKALGLSNLDPVLAEAVKFKLAFDGGRQPVVNTLEDFQERVCKKWMNGAVEQSGLAGHCHHIVSLTAPMAAGDPMTVGSLCAVMAFLATLARAVGVNLGDLTRSQQDPQAIVKVSAAEADGKFQRHRGCNNILTRRIYGNRYYCRW